MGSDLVLITKGTQKSQSQPQSQTATFSIAISSGQKSKSVSTAIKKKNRTNQKPTVCHYKSILLLYPEYWVGFWFPIPKGIAEAAKEQWNEIFYEKNYERDQDSSDGKRDVI